MANDPNWETLPKFQHHSRLSPEDAHWLDQTEKSLEGINIDNYGLGEPARQLVIDLRIACKLIRAME